MVDTGSQTRINSLKSTLPKPSKIFVATLQQEVLRSFGQVQLLVSDSDVKSYKQIKDDLDDLRLLVEKSELWVYKAVKQEDKKVSGK